MSETKVEVQERPILFSGEMIRAILDGRKTQTRRVIRLESKLSPIMLSAEVWLFGNKRKRCPYGKPGDRLWVREAYALESNQGIDDENGYPPPFDDGRPTKTSMDEDGEFWEQAHYKATDPLPDLACEHAAHDGGYPCPHPWRSSMFMPRWASRITLEITGVRVERLQDISEEDAKAEGAPRAKGNYFDPETHNFIDVTDANHCFGFRVLWDSINSGRGYGWDKNPWVWVIEFKRLVP